MKVTLKGLSLFTLWEFSRHTRFSLKVGKFYFLIKQQLLSREDLGNLLTQSAYTSRPLVWALDPLPQHTSSMLW